MHRLRPYCAPEFRPLANDTSDVPPELRAVLPPPADPWSISPELGVLLYRLVTEHHKSRILEFGAGSSSVILATALEQSGGGRLTSLEQNPEWCAGRWDAAQRMAGVDAELIGATPVLTWGRAGPAYAYQAASQHVAARGPYDLVLIDAPQYFYGRDGSLHMSFAHLSTGALIVVDDAARSGERWTIRRWLSTYSGLELRLYDPAFGGKGVAVLQVAGPLDTRFSPMALVSSAYHAAENWNKRRKRRSRAARDAPSMS